MTAALPAGFQEIEAAEIKRAFGSRFYLRLLGIPVVVGGPFSRWLESGRSVDTIVELGALAVGM